MVNYFSLFSTSTLVFRDSLSLLCFITLMKNFAKVLLTKFWASNKINSLIFIFSCFLSTCIGICFWYALNQKESFFCK